LTHKSLTSIFDIRISVPSIAETGSFSTETGFEGAILRWKADFKVLSGQYAGVIASPNRLKGTLIQSTCSVAVLSKLHVNRFAAPAMIPSTF
jgi:hypothetical protein